MTDCAKSEKIEDHDSLLRSHFLGCHTTLPPKKWLLTSEQHSFHEISQSPLPFHFQERFRAKFTLWDLSNQISFFTNCIFTSCCETCHKWWHLSLWTQTNFRLLFRAAEKYWWRLKELFMYKRLQSWKFFSSMLIGNVQFEKLLSRRKISFLTCLIKKLGNLVALLDL